MTEREVIAIRIADRVLHLDMPSDTVAALRPQLGGFFEPPSENRHGRLRVEQLPGFPDPWLSIRAPSAEVRSNGLWVGQPTAFELSLQRENSELRGELLYRRALSDVHQPHLGPAGIRGALAALWSLLLVEEGGLLLHGSGIVGHGLGAAFLGPSGSGKSTLASFFAADQVLNDELIAVKSTPPRIFSTPFSGTLDTPRKQLTAPWSVAFSLAKGEEIGSVPLLSAGGTAIMLRCITLPSGSPTHEKRAFENAIRLGQAVPFRELTFPKNGKAVRAALEALLSEQNHQVASSCDDR